MIAVPEAVAKRGIDMIESSDHGARHGTALPVALLRNPPNLWYDGPKLANPADFPACRNRLDILAGLNDPRWDHLDEMFLQSDSPSKKMSLSFVILRTKRGSKGVSKAMKLRSESIVRMLSRQQDYMKNKMTGRASGNRPNLGRELTSFSCKMRRLITTCGAAAFA